MKKPSILIPTLLILVVSSCSKKDPVPVNAVLHPGDATKFTIALKKDPPVPVTPVLLTIDATKFPHDPYVRIWFL